jgi:hypothetical protein
MIVYGLPKELCLTILADTLTMPAAPCDISREAEDVTEHVLPMTRLMSSGCITARCLTISDAPRNHLAHAFLFHQDLPPRPGFWNSFRASRALVELFQAKRRCNIATQIWKIYGFHSAGSMAECE